jgi:outer membrane protein OmpA-like peptidoglycan-associated protein
MPSSAALRAILTATVGFGVADLVAINVVLGPDAIGGDAPTLVASSLPTASPAPPRDEPVRAPVAAASAAIEAPSAPVRETPRAAEPREVRVYFATMSAVIDGTARAILKRIVERASATSVFTLEGRADIRGDESLNLPLSRQRAVMVADELAALGVPRTRIKVGFVGSTGAASAGELWRDRRVEVRIAGGVE